MDKFDFVSPTGQNSNGEPEIPEITPEQAWQIYEELKKFYCLKELLDSRGATK
jgi:hypothetical protein